MTLAEAQARIAELERDLATSKTAERNAARDARNERVQEVVLLLAWLTTQKGIDAHLAPCLTAGANATMNHVVCVHRGANKLVWRISDFEALEYFSHLKQRDCGGRGMSRADKIAYLAERLGSKG